jgi:hypothetical protein
VPHAPNGETGFQSGTRNCVAPSIVPPGKFHCCGRAEARPSPWRVPRGGSRFRATLLLRNLLEVTEKRNPPQPRRQSRYQGKHWPSRLFSASQKRRGRPARIPIHSPLA